LTKWPHRCSSVGDSGKPHQKISTALDFDRS
jgi:hypothetical protein